jgi:hypothetical protein
MQRRNNSRKEPKKSGNEIVKIAIIEALALLGVALINAAATIVVALITKLL